MKVSKVIWHETALEHYNYWKENDLDIVDKIKNLIASCKEHPFKGIGKPEPLKRNLSGYWSRRITKEHRFVYSYSNEVLTIIQCRFHY
jgi:toxin YoeB